MEGVMVMDEGAYGQDGADSLDRPMNSILDETPASNFTPVIKSQVNGQKSRQDRYTTVAQDPKISIAVDPVALITTECITVTSAMRKHARWAHSSVSAILGGGSSMANRSDINQLSRGNEKNSAARQRQAEAATNGVIGENDNLATRWGLRGKKGKSMQDNPLLSAFARLRNDLRGCTGQLFECLLLSI